MIRKTDYFKLGVYVICGLGLILLVVLVLGAGEYLKTTYSLETYVDESVNGLEIGSPVKYRGVKVGSVTEIGFVNGRYVDVMDSDVRYVYIGCSLEQKSLPYESLKQFGQAMARDVKNGLRARTVSLGLTGQKFLGLDFVDPEKNPVLKISWKPKSIYVPSAPSIMSRVEQAVATISDTLESINKEDIKGIVEAVRSASENLSSMFDKAGSSGIGDLLKANLEQTRRMFARLNDLLKAPGAESLIPDASRAAAGIRRVVEDSGGDLVVAVKDAREAIAGLKSSAARIDKYLSSPKAEKRMASLAETMANVNEASVKLKSAVTRLHEVLGRINGVLAGQQENVQGIMENTRMLI
ncbi:MAG: MlaD family protein, partial [Desulfovibrionaceae bacterium]|nr:MlaD family protein [Desulfovibrionaceae bacterium]